eukprot:gene20210-24194_t
MIAGNQRLVRPTTVAMLNGQHPDEGDDGVSSDGAGVEIGVAAASGGQGHEGDVTKPAATVVMTTAMDGSCSGGDEGKPVAAGRGSGSRLYVAVAVDMARAEVVRAVVMIMVKVHGRDGEGDGWLTRASIVMKAMTVSAATVPPAWTSSVAMTVVVTKAAMTRAAVMIMVAVHGRDGEGDDGVSSDGAGVDLVVAVAMVMARAEVVGDEAEWWECMSVAMTVVMAKAEVVSAAVMIMVEVHGRDGEGDERLTRASTVMTVMTVSAATVPAWTSWQPAVAVAAGKRGSSSRGAGVTAMLLRRWSMAVTVVVARAEVTRAAVMNMVKVNGRDGEGDERLTMASTLMKAMTVSAATVPAWTS